MSLEEFQALDQRITSGLGRRKVAYIQRVGRRTFALTPDGAKALRMFERTDVYRRFVTPTIARVYGDIQAAPRSARTRIHAA